MRQKFSDLTFEELIIRREELRKEYFKTQCDKVIAHVQNSAKIRATRRQIAQLNTLIYNHTDVKET